MASKIIKNNVVGGETLAWDILKTYEFNSLKPSDNRDVSKLKNAIVNSGFSFPIYIWNEHRYVIDGKGRDIALNELEKDGYVIPDLPVSYIKADNKAQAKRLALQASSQHGQITEESFKEFTFDLELEPLDLEMFDLGDFELFDLGLELEEISEQEIDDYKIDSFEEEPEEDAPIESEKPQDNSIKVPLYCEISKAASKRFKEIKKENSLSDGETLEFLIENYNA